MNPYAAPKAKLEDVLPAGTLWREGNLVRMDRGGALPDRCVVCNQQSGKRVSRTLYWSPAAWRLFSIVTPVAMLVIGIGGVTVLAVLFWPVILVLVIAHFFVRKKLKLDFGICERHQRLRNALAVLSVAAMITVVVVSTNLSGDDASVFLLLAAIVAVIALAVAQSFVGVQAVSLKRLDREHAWLGGTGKTFREALPELPGA